MSELIDQALETMMLESRFLNLRAKEADEHYSKMNATYGDRIILTGNGHPQRTKHEVFSGLSAVKRKGLEIDALVVNLPFTVLCRRGNPAETAFTDGAIEHRHIYLVPDHTPTRILKDTAYHTDRITSAVSSGELSADVAERWVKKMNSLNVGDRVAASIIHEYGHILTYRALDKAGVDNNSDLYDVLDDIGYLDNCSRRIIEFSKRHPLWQLNVALEQLAEDFRLSIDRKRVEDISSFPSFMTDVQDIANPSLFFEGVDIMAKLFDLSEKRNHEVANGNSLSDVMPFGEASRTSSVSTQFGYGSITPLTDEDKKRAREILKDLM